MVARPRIGDGYTEYPVGTLGADECRPGQVFHRIHYDRSGFSLLQYIQQSNLLAVIWRNVFKLANRIPLIPVLTALTCLFLSAFLFEMTTLNDVYFVPARVLAGLGGICFTLFSIVSILESGTSN